MILRPYQQAAVDKTLAGFEQFYKQLLVVPTGGGKTILFSHLAKAVQPKKTLILAHREELIDQAIDKLHQATGIVAGKEKAEFCASLDAPVVVASVQSMIRRLDKWPSDHFGLVVADEAHHAISDSWQKVLRHFDRSAWVLGVTATPDRSDKRDLGCYFENIPFEISLFDLINQKYLSRISLKSIPLQIDLSGVKQKAGDFDETGLADAISPYFREIARAIKREAAFRRTLVFLPLINTSKEFCKICNDEGLTTEHVDGHDEHRKEKLERFAAGEWDLLCNAMLLTEGFDDPGIDCVVVLRPTKSRALYSQMVGRGTRISGGKANLLLLDFLWLHESHNLVRPAHLIATSNDFAEAITEASQKAGGHQELDLQDLATDTQAKREEKLRRELEEKAKRKARIMDAAEFADNCCNDKLLRYEPVMPWELKPITDAQRDILERNKIDLDSVKGFGHANAIIDTIITRSKQGLASARQLKLLRQLRYPHWRTATAEQASSFLDARLKRR